MRPTMMPMRVEPCTIADALDAPDREKAPVPALAQNGSGTVEPSLAGPAGGRVWRGRT
jgi:hypothetical protein